MDRRSRPKRRARLGAALGTTLALAGLASCDHGRSGGNCAYENWRGTCQLKSVNQVRLIESMPAIAVVEALYEPEPAPPEPTLLPPPRRQEFRVRAEQVDDLRAHLQKFPTVQCEFQERKQGACAEGALVVSVPEFIPPPPPDVRADAGVSESGGCVELDRGRTAAQGAAAELPEGVPPELRFQPDSSESTPELEQQVAKVADALKQHPEIECMAVIGHVTAGERTIVGDERAATVKNLLVTRGIASKRLQTIAAVVPMTGGAPRQVIEADRKVRLRVLLRAQ